MCIAGVQKKYDFSFSVFLDEGVNGPWLPAYHHWAVSGVVDVTDRYLSVCNGLVWFSFSKCFCPFDSCVVLLWCRCCWELRHGNQNSNTALPGRADGPDVSQHGDVLPDQEEKVQIQVEPHWPSKHAMNIPLRHATGCHEHSHASQL